MAVESFLKPAEAKQTIEKEVKVKPSLAELTTIERPGKPTPASFLVEEKQENKKTRKKRTEKADDETVSIREPKKDSILIITEKPQAALKIANALGKAEKYAEEGVAYYELQRGLNKIIVASAVGHLFNLTYKKGQKGWPIFDLEWVPSYLSGKQSAFTKRYFDLLKKLVKKAKEIVIATDFDIEGEVIGWNVLRFIGKQSKAKRMKFSTLTPDELVKAFENPLPDMAWANAYAGESRHIIDWLYGINLSRALMSSIKQAGAFRILSIGRVQGPALKIIVDREKQITNFKSQPFWQVSAIKNDIPYRHPEDIFQKDLLEKFKKIKDCSAETKEKQESTQPPVPFDLTTLQREAYRLHKFSPSETLKIAQQLYLDGLISYPRTSSQKIPKEIEPKKILKKLEKKFKEIKLATRDKPVEGKKSDPAHPSIYPTGDFGKMSEQAEKLYNIIARRFIAAFSPDALTLNKKTTLTALDAKGNPLKYVPVKPKEQIEEEQEDEENNEDKTKENKEENKQEKEIKITFSAFGLKILDKGWTSVYPAFMDEKEIPDLNGKIKIDEIKIEEKETQPPNRYTPTGLVSLLEKRNLGTKATRSMIVDTLFNRGYLDGKSIKATELGKKLIDALEKYSPIIIDENLTRQLEDEMQKIQESLKDFEIKEKAVVEKAKRLINDIAKEFKTKESEIGKSLAEGIIEVRKEQQINNTLQQCPTCKKGNLRIMFNRSSHRYFIACSAYPDCKQTYSLPPNALIKKSGNQCEADKFPKLLAIRKAKRPWEFCFNPDCPIEKAKRESREEKYANKNNKEGKDVEDN